MTIKASRLVRAVTAAGTALLVTVVLSGAAEARPFAPEHGGTEVAGRRGPVKGAPPIGQPPDLAAPAGVRFLYAAAGQRGTAPGAIALMTIHRPSVAAADYHSLGELAVSSADGRQIVEVGWTVDPRQFGDTQPHLFVYHWVDGQPSCYNGCGFVPYASGTFQAGDVVPVGSQRWPFAIRHVGSVWEIYFGLNPVGHFPDSLWGGRFTEVEVVQAFGEVAAASSAPCTDMGNGTLPTLDSGAEISQLSFLPRPGPAIDVTPLVTAPTLYDAVKPSARSLRYGGPGVC